MIRFAVFTDLHYDHIFDGERRLDEFLDAIKEEPLDFILSLGDLCYPIEKNRKLIEKLNRRKLPVYYVIGNHDSDHFTQNQVKEFLKLDDLYYCFTIENTKFIVLNSCYVNCNGVDAPYYKKNYEKESSTYPVIPEFELNWLERELENKELSYVIFSHHSLANDFMNRGIANRMEVQRILSSRRTLLCMNGHDHGDDCKMINAIPYYTLNACSYIWHGQKAMVAYDREVHKQYPYLKDMILYKEALHCVVELCKDKVKIKGMEGEYLSTTPEQVGICNRRWNGVSIEPRVSRYESKKTM